MEDLRKTIGENLSQLRREKKMTQAELASRFGYSDKAVSKWEKGDTIPDVETLYKLCEFYGVSLDYLTHEGKKEEKGQYITKNQKRILINNILIELLVISFVWILASIVYVYLIIFSDIIYWQCFIVAIPASFLAGLLFIKVYKNKMYNFFCLSGLLWTLLLACYITIIQYNAWALFFLGIPIQVALVLNMLIRGKLISK